MFVLVRGNEISPRCQAPEAAVDMENLGNSRFLIRSQRLVEARRRAAAGVETEGSSRRDNSEGACLGSDTTYIGEK